VVGTEGELFIDEACFDPTDVDDFDSSGKGEVVWDLKTQESLKLQTTTR
jgi:hypothetical protein